MHDRHHHHRFASAMRSQRPALGMLLAWLALLAMVLGGLPGFAGHVEHAAPTAAAQAPMGQETGHPPGAPCTEQDEPPAKPRRTSSTALAKATTAEPTLLSRGSTPLILAIVLSAPPRHQPAIVDAPATPLPTPPGLRMQRGQAPPLA